ncbi:MAG TPA: thiamine phosphate synthase [Acidimicrobiales bacterium]|nr:thiamine phosphate synthase [Acidimicrobiales bacterium]
MTRGFPGRDELVVVTDRAQAGARGRTLPDVVAAAVEGGARTVLFREKDLPAAERWALAEAVAERLRPVDGVLLVASDVALAVAVGAAGVHLAGADPWPDDDDRQLAIGRSCHSADELGAALTWGADYVSLSPIWPSPSKPGYGPALGSSGLAAACAAVPALPVVALGGVTAGRAAECRAAGAVAVAVMGEVMRSDDPAGCVRVLLAGLHGVREAS